MASAWRGPAEVIEYGDMYHELFNEIDKERVINELIAWLDNVDLSHEPSRSVNRTVVGTLCQTTEGGTASGRESDFYVDARQTTLHSEGAASSLN